MNTEWKEGAGLTCHLPKRIVAIDDLQFVRLDAKGFHYIAVQVQLRQLREEEIPPFPFVDVAVAEEDPIAVWRSASVAIQQALEPGRTNIASTVALKP